MLPGDAAPFEAVKQTQMIGLSPHDAIEKRD